LAPILLSLLIPGCLEKKKEKSNNGPKGQDHELAIGAIQPDEGLAIGGEDVLIIGFNFQQDRPVTEVLFGDVAADSFIVRSNNQIDAVTPRHPWGAVDVTLRNADGDEATLPDGFTFHPVVRDCLTLDPTFGPDAGGTPVTIATSRFTDDFTATPPNVYFGGVPAMSVIAVDAFTVIAMTPAHPAGAVDVTVESGDALEFCTFPQGYVYESSVSPGCISLSISLGPLTGGQSLSISNHGACAWNSSPPPMVYFGGEPCTVVIFVDPGLLAVMTPPQIQPGVVDVEVVDQVVPCSCVLPDGYTYYGSGDCLSLAPRTGPTTGGTTVTIETFGFADDFTVHRPVVYFDATLAPTVVVLDSETIQVVTPPDPHPDPKGLPHPVYVTVMTTGIPEMCVFYNGFAYITPTMGPCLVVDPDTGPQAGGNTVRIISQGPCVYNTNPTRVEFGGVSASFVYIDPSTLEGTVPAGVGPGPVDVLVESWDVVSGSCPCYQVDAYTYQ
jgi:hypothetical protein